MTIPPVPSLADLTCHSLAADDGDVARAQLEGIERAQAQLRAIGITGRVYFKHDRIAGADVLVELERVRLFSGASPLLDRMRRRASRDESVVLIRTHVMLNPEDKARARAALKR